MRRMEDAANHAKIAVENAEKGLELKPDHPPAMEILAITLNSYTQALAVTGKMDEALAASQKSIEICEKIYPKNDPRLHKPLRSLAMILDKKGDKVESEKTLVKAYTLLHISVGPQVPEAQMLSDEIVGMYLSRGQVENAEKHALKNFKAVSEKTDLNDRDLLILADSATRYASLLVRSQKFAEAEPVVMKALNLREQSRIFPRNPIGIAISIVQLAGIREELNKLDQELVQLMIRAVDIFSKVRGPQSQEVSNTVQQMQRIRSKLSSADTKKDKEDDDDKLSYTVKDSKKPNSSASSKLLSSAKTNEISEEDRKKIESIPADNANARMMLANMYFEQAKYNCAEILLAQALDLFMKQVGPEHQATKAARQNLTVVRNQRLNQLWMEVVSEEAIHLQNLHLSKFSGFHCECRFVTNLFSHRFRR
jgi:tetratricopeptide (TPR) repeat protein